jgi:hypothetical protein
LSAYADIEIKRSFGVLFIAVALAILFAAPLSLLLSNSHLPYFYYLVLWLGSFCLSLGIVIYKRRKVFSSVRLRMKKSLGWPLQIKIINGLCWAGPFSFIPVFHQLYPYLILLGIGLGNISTYFFIKKYSNGNNKEQLLVGLIAICIIPISILVDNIIFSKNYEVALLFSRLSIAASYGTGGVYALIGRQ